MNEEFDDAELLGLVEDQYARAILLEASRRTMSAATLAEAINASPPTVYRRLDDLVRCGLLARRTEFVDGGPNFSVYATRIEELTVGFVDGQLTVRLTDRESLPIDETTAERFVRLYEALG